MKHYAIGKPGESIRMCIQVSNEPDAILNCKDGEILIAVEGHMSGLVSADGLYVIHADIDLEIEADKIRETRTAKLAASDWTQTLDAQISEEDRAAWAVYRQTLRDITATQDGVIFDNVVWPEEPTP